MVKGNKIIHVQSTVELNHLKPVLTLNNITCICKNAFMLPSGIILVVSGNNKIILIINTYRFLLQFLKHFSICSFI